MLNYHELTMDEPRDSPQRRQQFLVICTIMAGIFLHTCTVSGVFSALNVKEGIFPGGEFVYKYDVRDYSTSAGLARSIVEDLDIGEIEQGDFLYSIFLDSPMAMGGANQRFATGILVDKTGRDKKKRLMGLNEGIRAVKYTDDDDDYSVEKVWKQIEYKSTSLPSLDAAIVQFPFTNGFVSALTHSYKVIPALRKVAKQKGEKGNVPIVITTCSITQEMCTHYAPLIRGKDFLLGKPAQDEYLKTLPYKKWFDFNAIRKNLKRMFPPLHYILS